MPRILRKSPGLAPSGIISDTPCLNHTSSLRLIAPIASSTTPSPRVMPRTSPTSAKALSHAPMKRKYTTPDITTKVAP
jgi:hypothetical protein